MRAGFDTPISSASSGIVSQRNGECQSPKIRKSLKDTDCLAAVTSGDMETAHRMVGEAAKQFGTELETAENAVKAMQQVLSEAANSKSQNRSLTNKQSFDYTENNIRKSGGGYWYPRLNQSEWDLLKRKLDEGIQSEDGFIDQSTKWLFASEKGTNVFAVYGIGDGTDPTPLYACGGALAKKYGAETEAVISGGKYNGHSRILVRIFAQNVSKQQSKTSNSSSDGNREAEHLPYRVSEQTSKREYRQIRSDGRRDSGGSIEDQSESSLVKKSLKDTDSNGNPLSAGQQQYFSNSAVRNAEGQLKVVYHGTDAEFTVFDFMKAGSKVGRAEGYGFYFTDSPEVAAHYGNSKEYYLNITKPLNGMKKTMSRSDFRKIVSGLLAYDLQEQAADGLTWQDSFLSNYIYTYGMGKASAIRQVADMMFDSNDSDVEMIYELANSDGRNYSPEGIKPLHDVVTRELNIDNAEKSNYNGSKNKNGGEQDDGNRVDRGVAEGVSLRQVSDRTEASERYGENGRGNQKPPGVLRISNDLNKAFYESGVVATELYDYSGDSAAYSSALDAARNADEKNGWCVTPQSAEELTGKILRMDANNSIGYVLSDGDIEAVFKNLNMETAQQMAGGDTKAQKNTTREGDVLPSKKNKNTKTSAASPLSRGPATQGSLSMASKPVTAAAENLDISVSLSQTSDSVKRAIVLFSDIVTPTPAAALIQN